MRFATPAPFLAIAACLGLSGCVTVPDEGSATCPNVSRGWQAWISAMPGPGSKPTLHIQGTVDMPTPGYTVELVGGSADRMQPPGLRFQLEATPPDGMTTQVITSTEVRYAEPTPYSQIREIIITCDGETLATIDEVGKMMRQTIQVLPR